MKKVLFISLLATLAICGCQKKELEFQPVGSIKFTATIEDDFGDTKTSLDGQGNVLWKKGNQVSIFNGSTINQQYQVTDASEGKTAAGLIPVSPAGFVAGGEIDNNVALYPYSSTAEIVKNEETYVISGITLPGTQNYAAGSFGDGAFPMAAVTSSVSDLNLKFKNILGCLKLQLKGTASIASITVTGNNNEILCGAVCVTVANGSIPSINLTDASAKTVILDCGAGVALNTSTATPFVIALPPMAMTGGFTVVVKDTEGKQMEIKTTKSQTIVRSKILKMPEVNYEGETPKSEGKPLTFISIGSTTISLEKEGTPYDISLEYKLNNGVWKPYTIGTAISLNDKDQLAFQAGEGGNTKFNKVSGYGQYFYYFHVVGTGKIAAAGNIMSLVDKNMSSLIIPDNGYFGMIFSGCTSLTQAPELPATTLTDYCYYYMFKGCTSLTTAPELPATTLTVDCYGGMFSGCTSLTKAPELHATTLKKMSYESMFDGCTSLTTAPKLPATTLESYCYSYMFYGCTSLSIAPELPATDLEDGCYESMFDGCSNLNYVKALFTTTPSSYYTDNWLSGVSSTGTFVKSKDAAWDVTGANGIPEGWTVQTE